MSSPEQWDRGRSCTPPGQRRFGLDEAAAQERESGDQGKGIKHSPSPFGAGAVNVLISCASSFVESGCGSACSFNVFQAIGCIVSRL
jgi:hypothetical protein